jgi:multiple sugar transport system permease protein
MDHHPKRDSLAAAALLAPGLVILSIFGIFPLGYAVYLSLHGASPSGSRFLGTQHYRTALGSEEFWSSAANTLYYAVGTVPIGIVLGLGVALLLHRVGRFQRILQTAYFLPYITSVVAAAMIWRVMLEPSHGVFTTLFETFGLPAQTWLLEPRSVLHLLSGGRFAVDTGPSLALCCIIVFEIWHALGFTVVLLLAGLTSIPTDCGEAARLDGAGSWATFRHITLPLLSPTLFFLTIVGTIGAFQAFSSFYALTGNGRGPLDTTQNLTVYIYANFYEYGKIGYGSAVAILLSLALILLTVVQWRWLGRKVHYQ